jgi:hypothetical protein
VTEVNATGTAIVYSTFLGRGNYIGGGIAMDDTGNADVTGFADSTIYLHTASHRPTPAKRSTDSQFAIARSAPFGARGRRPH